MLSSLKGVILDYIQGKRQSECGKALVWVAQRSGGVSREGASLETFKAGLDQALSNLI